MSSLIVVVCLLLGTLTASQSECEDVQQKINDIDNEIQRLKNQSKDHCRDYGIEKLNGHEHMGPTPHDLQLFTVCYESQNAQKKLYVKAVVGTEDLYKGTEVTKASRATIRENSQPCSPDESVHIVPMKVGGVGEPYNIIAQPALVYLNVWEPVRDKITDHLRKTVNDIIVNYNAQTANHVLERTATIEVAFVCNDLRHASRPSSILYKYKLYEDEIKVKTMSGTFDNVNADYDYPVECEIDSGRQQLFLVNASHEFDEALQTCNVADKYKHLFD
ncbi:hypothetical protein M3Y94_01244900 [Aphelenchoides besseyi]|nr:hypothetical protein M3Y94_01244900 [Aphelenchoides besseyi]KAI6219362.1 hypothetical protein M3Y95_01103100 [Aphelenchoides besseyi]